MTVIFYGPGTAPTQKELAEAVVKYKGNCGQFLRYCRPRHMHDVSTRDGDACPLNTPFRHCPPSEIRVADARRWLMEML